MDPIKIKRARSTVIEMLRQRGFVVTEALVPLDEERLSIMSDFFWKRPKERSSVFDIHVENSDSQAYVAWIKPDNIKNQYLSVTKQFYGELHAGSSDDLIIVVATDTVPTETMYRWENHQISVFSIANLQVNITKHRLVPEHTLLSTSEAKRIRRLYQASIGKFPTINRFDSELGSGDAVGRFYGMRVGDVVRIKREAPTSGTHWVYREVVGDEPNPIVISESQTPTIETEVSSQ